MNISILSNKVNLLDMNRDMMYDFMASIGEKKFYASQIMQWIYHYGCNEISKMTTLSIRLRKKLDHISIIYAPKIVEEYCSIDGSIKWILEVDYNHQKIEMVYIPEKNRNTLCISSQVGCSLKCNFCATGKQGFNRNLKVSEIIGQVWQAKKMINSCNKKKMLRPITNIVFMGMGEPLLNVKNVVLSIQIMLDTYGFFMSKRKITISTVGIVPALKKLINKIDVVLAVSLHAPTNHLRNKLIPINNKYKIETLLESAQQYVMKSSANKGLLSIEYVMLYNVNDTIFHAYQLVNCLKNITCKINLINWNPVPGISFSSSTESHILKFYKILKRYNFITTIRQKRGQDIQAACGQLTGNIINKIKLINLNVM